jgi:ABC-type glycerol-3-phosphate transport system substrate-binding protein
VTRDELYALGMSATDASWFQLLLGQRGGKVLDAPNGKAAFHQQPGIDALAQLTDLAQRKRTLKITSTAAGDFAAGQLASLMSGEWQIRFYRADGTPHDTGFFPRQKASDPPSTLLGVDGFYITASTPDVDLAARFAMAMTDAEAQRTWSDVGAHVPADTTVEITDELVQVFADAAENSVPRPQNEELNNFWGNFGDAQAKITEQDADPTQAVADACAAMNEANQK